MFFNSTSKSKIEFDTVTSNSNIYIINDTDFVGGWTGYCAKSGGTAIKNNNTKEEYKVKSEELIDFLDEHLKED